MGTAGFAQGGGESKRARRKVSTPELDPLRRQVLSDRALHEAIRRVVRAKGVPEQDVEDVLNSVIAAAMDDEHLPLHDAKEASTYLCTCARNQSISDGRKRGTRRRRNVPIGAKNDPAGTLTPEHTAMAERLLREAQVRFPKTFMWFVRAEIKGEAQIDIALEDNVRPDKVRREVMNIRNTLRGLGMLGVVLALLLFAYPRIGPRGVIHTHELSNTGSVPSIAPPPAPSAPPSAAPSPLELARALRDRAQQEFKDGQWDLVEIDLDKARELDPQEPPAVVQMRKTNEHNLDTFNAKP